MSLTLSHQLFINSLPSSRSSLFFATNPRNPNHFSLLSPITSRSLIHISHSTPFTFTPKFYHSLKLPSSHNPSITPQTHESFNLDSVLSVFEFVCLVSSTVIAIGFFVNYSILGTKVLVGLMGKRVLASGVVALVCGVWTGAVLRRRQLWRIGREKGGAVGSGSVNLVERIERLEEDLRSYATIIRVLSRQLEKLGIRFRVTRKALKEPITQAATLAQKNSEATRALAMQEDILEKELGEIQKVLLAMQEQQQKQLELILAIGKTGKLFESKRESNQELDTLKTSNMVDVAEQMETHKTQATGSGRGSNNDRS
ncbi:hypothetical protein Pint_27604 [Pistacia integerrima]|uniref:Uncharacterized protein n=1 Tax=Pistacia integerrima TaxID=434235 RepID=A0ACC0YTV3_9ROSI|nr:hypothetical protein Pint_27604 [Pistacia integerrima]